MYSARLPLDLVDIIKRALSEDIGKGDFTSSALLRRDVRTKAYIICKDNSYLCGVNVAQEVFRQVDRNIEFRAIRRDGEYLKSGTVVASLTGRARSILTGERVALNFLQRLSGICSMTRAFVNKAKKYGVQILDTRKTTPCLRQLERYAVRTGGGMNHRFDLSDAAIIKDNHLRGIRSITVLQNSILRLRKKVRFVEIEAQNMRDALRFASLPVDVIMLDNMSVSGVSKTARLIRSKRPDLIIEVSGGINLSNVESYAKCDIDWISTGMITHSARAVNFCLDLTPPRRKSGDS